LNEPLRLDPLQRDPLQRSALCAKSRSGAWRHCTSPAAGTPNTELGIQNFKTTIHHIGPIVSSSSPYLIATSLFQNNVNATFITKCSEDVSAALIEKSPTIASKESSISLCKATTQTNKQHQRHPLSAFTVLADLHTDIIYYYPQSSPLPSPARSSRPPRRRPPSPSSVPSLLPLLFTSVRPPTYRPVLPSFSRCPTSVWF
jgi:hypothetical protein